MPPCDGCNGTNYDGVEYVEVRVARPSCPAELVCIMAGCSNCFPGSRTPSQWEDYFESGEAAKAGFAWLT